MGAWVSVGIMVIIIIVSLPLTPVLWRAALKVFGPWFNAIGYVVFAVVFLAFLAHMIRHRADFGFFGFLLVGSLAAVYLYLLRYLCHYPADRVHFAEYGLLAYLLRRAFRLDVSSAKAYIYGLLCAAGFGVLDECIQYMLPNRVFEVRDILTNVLAAALGLLVVALVIRPDSRARP